MKSKKWPVAEWVTLVTNGRSVLSVAKQYGVSFYTVNTQLLRAGCVRPAWQMPPLSDIDAAWIAAVIDCEGTLTVHTPYNKHRNNRNIQIFCRVDMTDDGIPRRLHKLCAGTFRELHRRPNDPVTNRPHCYWNLSSNGLRWLLPQIYPYMIVKKRNAEIIAEILRRNGRGSKSSQIPHAELYPLIAELRSLNKGGSHAHMDKVFPSTRQSKTEIINATAWSV